jgi:undecaprenyl diphosphate synthase
VLFGYSGKAELLRAVAQMRETNEDVTDANFEKYLATGFVPQADFVIRTGVRGDPHWSDWFLFWQTGNSQLYFTETPWPAFGKKELTQALEDYRKRQRRLGA